MPLLRSQHSLIFKALKEATLNPETDFQWEDEGSVLRHRELPFFIQFNDHGNAWSVIYSPGEEREREEHRCERWPNVEPHIPRWAGFVRREIDNPDPWERLGAEEDERAFTADEAAKIATAVGRIEQYLAAHNDVSQDMRDQLHELAEAAREEKRGQWKKRFVTILTGIATGLALDPEKARALFNFAVLAVQSAFGHAPLQLPDLTLT
jgi:hypothetical protein